MRPLVSIIVPSYNNARYLPGCLDSLIGQTYENIEIIVVNDGSKDNTEDIINSYKQKDARILSVFQQNAGPQSARNSGLEQASGDYIVFVDADDTVPAGGIENMVALAEDGVDMVVSSYIEYWLYKKPHIYPNLRIASSQKDECFLSFIRKTITPWKTLYKRSIIEKHHLRFDKTMFYAEDYYFNIYYLKYVEGDIVISDKPVYNYYTYRSSQNRRYFPDIYQYYLRILDAAFDYFEGKDFKLEYQRYFADFYMATLMEYYTFEAKTKREAEEKIQTAYQSVTAYFDDDILRSIFTAEQYEVLASGANNFIDLYYGKRLTTLKVRAFFRKKLLNLKKQMVL